MRVSYHGWQAALLMVLVPWIPMQAQTRSSELQLDLSAEAGYQDAVRFQSPDDPGDRYSRVRAGLLRHWNGARGAFDLVLSGDATKYGVLSDLDRFNYGVAARGSRRLTPRATGTFSAAARSVIASELSVPSPDAGTPGEAGNSTTEPASAELSAGPRLPRVAAHLIGTEAAFTYLLSPHTSTTFSADYSHASFDSPLLVASGSAGGHTTLQHRLGRRGTGRLQADVQRGSAQGQPLRSEDLAAGWEQKTGPLTSRIIAGATRSMTQDGSHVEPTGAALLAADVGGGTAAIEYSRRVSQALGLGTLLTSNRVVARYQHGFFDAWALTMSGSHAWSRDPNLTIGRLANTDGVADLRRVFASGLVVGGAVTYRRREQAQLPTLRGFESRVYLGVLAGV